MPCTLILFCVFPECGQINNCTQCFLQAGAYKCITCHDGFAINVAQTACCSAGCYKDSNGYVACYVNQTCVYEGCNTGFLGPKCTPYAACSVCKPGWFLYQNTCDQCGTTCVSPPNGTARCDPVTGSCYYGCQPNYHGSKCQRLCNLANCNTCSYNEPSDNLKCAVCVAGRYGPYCTPCNSNCLKDTGDICIHNGTCLDGCRPGYRGDKCDVSCAASVDLANCAVCDRYQFSCTVCKPGFWGPKCQSTCGVNCVEFSGARYCNISDGTCRDGCMPTYFKHDCSGSCPNCANNVCHRTTGTCLDPICDSGFFGETCNQSCPANCGLDPNGLAYCDFTSGDCTYGCRDGYYGAKCTLGCSQFCKRSPANTEMGPLCNQATGNCLYACEPGFYTPTCGAVCRSTCVDKTCDINSGTCAECDKGINAGVLCPTGTCDVSFYGNFCTTPCPGGSNCSGSTCERYTAMCKGCISGRYGDHCERTCSNCASGVCDQTFGVCQGACVDGYFGETCDTRCGNRCTRCAQFTGACLVCNVGAHGTYCEFNCSNQCLPLSSGIISCNKVNGYCDSGACVPGFYRPTCTSLCSSNCKDVVCELQSGNCTNGCNVGWFGRFCDGTCSANCVNRNCLGSADSCLEGCVPEMYGPQCNIPCNSNCSTGVC
ncbi:hypothetical protein DPMN_038707 [Dreissena polymorpha]|uniref:EGF-like domain-containing protein n=1 Tax=Dreissena polymorpha TaxID=45954 RepID=A0A9D4MHL0_DREPO|nr:hypothetical protein DPMN_038707 [Dreissena polymorpha]